MKALVIIDLQNDFFVDPPLRARKDEVVRRIQELIDRAGSAAAPVIVVRTVHAPDGSTWALNMRDDRQGMAIEGTEGAEVVPEIEVHRPVEIQKTRDSAFTGTELAAVLHDLGVDHLVLAGVSTEACIAMTAADAYAHDLRVTLAVDAMDSANPEAHRQALSWLSDQYRQPLCHNDAVSFD